MPPDQEIPLTLAALEKWARVLVGAIVGLVTLTLAAAGAYYAITTDVQALQRDMADVRSVARDIAEMRADVRVLRCRAVPQDCK